MVMEGTLSLLLACLCGDNKPKLKRSKGKQMIWSQCVLEIRAGRHRGHAVCFEASLHKLLLVLLQMKDSLCRAALRAEIRDQGSALLDGPLHI